MTASPLAIAARVRAAERDRTAIEPFTDAAPDLGEAAAYAAQAAVVAERLSAGEQVIGAKLGLTSAAKQQTMGVDQPLYGFLTSGMLLDGAAALPTDRWIHPRVEPEIAFVLGRALHGPASIADVLAATSGVCAAIEVIDSRYAGFRFRLPDVIADNASAAGLVLGPVLLPPADAGDLRLTGCVLRRDGEVVATAAGAAVLGHPAAAVAWLAGRLAAEGQSLPAGSLILSGALTDAIPIPPGTYVSAELAGLGTVEVHS